MWVGFILEIRVTEQIFGFILGLALIASLVSRFDLFFRVDDDEVVVFNVRLLLLFTTCIIVAIDTCTIYDSATLASVRLLKKDKHE